MAGNEDIIADIIRCVTVSDQPDLGWWRIVLTNNVDESYTEWGSPAVFFSWKAGSYKDAKAVVTYLVNGKGMVGASTAPLDSGRPASICLFPSCDPAALQRQCQELARRRLLSPLFSVKSSNER